MSLETLKVPRSLSKGPELFTRFKKIDFFIDFHKVPNIKFHLNPSTGRRADVFGRTDGRM
jgi:hypothetical protein